MNATGSRLSSTLLRAWQGRGLLASLLWPLSWLYGFVVRFRQGLFISGVFKSHKLPVPVVVVGNVVAGGAGKTPLVMALVLHLKAQGIQVGVISRGFGARRVRPASASASDEVHEVLPNSLPQDVGDEPLLIRRTTGVPVFTGVNRYAAGQALLARHPETQLILSDDGLQHLALQRDLEVVVFDDRGLGNGWLLPAGPLREPWPRPCDLVLHTGRKQAFGGFGSTRTLAPQARNAKGDALPLAELMHTRTQTHRPVVALAAIARPEAFFEMLRDLDVPLAATLSLPDHFDFSDWQLPAELLASNSSDLPLKDSPLVLCTEKDAVKLWQHHPEFWAVPLVFTPEPAFWKAFDKLLNHLHQTL